MVYRSHAGPKTCLLKYGSSTLNTTWGRSSVVVPESLARREERTDWHSKLLTQRTQRLSGDLNPQPLLFFNKDYPSDRKGTQNSRVGSKTCQLQTSKEQLSNPAEYSRASVRENLRQTIQVGQLQILAVTYTTHGICCETHVWGFRAIDWVSPRHCIDGLILSPAQRMPSSFWF